MTSRQRIALVFIWILELISHLYSILILTLVWDWYVVPTLHAPEMPFWGMFGIRLLVVLLMEPLDGGYEKEWMARIEKATTEACVPRDQKDPLEKRVKELTEDLPDAGGIIFGILTMQTATLVFAFLIRFLFF